MIPICASCILSVVRADFFQSGGGYNVLINNTLRNESDVVTDVACFRIRYSEIN